MKTVNRYCQIHKQTCDFFGDKSPFCLQKETEENHKKLYTCGKCGTKQRLLAFVRKPNSTKTWGFSLSACKKCEQKRHSDRRSKKSKARGKPILQLTINQTTNQSDSEESESIPNNKQTIDELLNQIETFGLKKDNVWDIVKRSYKDCKKAHGNILMENCPTIIELLESVIEQKTICPYCTRFFNADRPSNRLTMSLDRTNVEIVGYRNNFKWTCLSCNLGKNRFCNFEDSHEHFRQMNNQFIDESILMEKQHKEMTGLYLSRIDDLLVEVKDKDQIIQDLSQQNREEDTIQELEATIKKLEAANYELKSHNKKLTKDIQHINSHAGLSIPNIAQIHHITSKALQTINLDS